MLPTYHPGNSSPGQEVNELCSLVPTPAVQFGHSKEGTRLPYGDGRMDRNSPIVLLAALFQCFIVPHLLNKTCPHQSFLLANQQAGSGKCLLCHHSQLPKTAWGDKSLRGYTANLEELVKLLQNFGIEIVWWFCPYGSSQQKGVSAGSFAPALPCHKIELKHIKNEKVFTDLVCKPCETRAEWNGRTYSICWVVFHAPC